MEINNVERERMKMIADLREAIQGLGYTVQALQRNEAKLKDEISRLNELLQPTAASPGE